MDVKRLTIAIQLMADQALDLHKKLDNDMFNQEGGQVGGWGGVAIKMLRGISLLSAN